MSNKFMEQQTLKNASLKLSTRHFDSVKIKKKDAGGGGLIVESGKENFFFISQPLI